MDRGYSLPALYLITAYCLSVAHVQAESQMLWISPELNDKRCLLAEVDFVVEGLQSGLLTCAAKCFYRDTCYSVFYNALTGTCTGCTSVYIYTYMENPSILQDESGTIHITVKIDCGPPDVNPKSEVSVTTTTFSSTATYTCTIYGYTSMQGSATRTCQLDATWSETAPTCDPVDCGAPPSDLVLSDFSGNTRYPSQYQIRCYHCTSYPQNGNTMSCQGNGQWSSHTPCIHGTELGLLANGDPIPPNPLGCVNYLATTCSSTSIPGLSMYGEMTYCWCDVVCCDYNDCCFDADCR